MSNDKSTEIELKVDFGCELSDAMEMAVLTSLKEKTNVFFTFNNESYYVHCRLAKAMMPQIIKSRIEQFEKMRLHINEELQKLEKENKEMLEALLNIVK